MITESQNFKAKAEEKLQKMREESKKWGVSHEIQAIREYVAQAGISLADIGTSED